MKWNYTEYNKWIKNGSSINLEVVVGKELEEAGKYSVEKHRELVQKELVDRRYPSEVIEVWIENIE